MPSSSPPSNTVVAPSIVMLLSETASVSLHRDRDQLLVGRCDGGQRIRPPVPAAAHPQRDTQILARRRGVNILRRRSTPPRQGSHPQTHIAHHSVWALRPLQLRPQSAGAVQCPCHASSAPFGFAPNVP